MATFCTRLQLTRPSPPRGSGRALGNRSWARRMARALESTPFLSIIILEKFAVLVKKHRVCCVTGGILQKHLSMEVIVRN